MSRAQRGRPSVQRCPPNGAGIGQKEEIGRGGPCSPPLPAAAPYGPSTSSEHMSPHLLSAGRHAASSCAAGRKADPHASCQELLLATNSGLTI